MTRQALHRALALAAAMVAGCVPARFAGYRPAGAGVMESAACVAGIRDTLRATAARGVEILWRAGLARGEILLDVALVVPAGVSVRLRSAAVVLDSPDWPSPRTLDVARLTAPGPVSLAPTALLVGAADRSRGTYSLWFRSGAGQPGATGIAPSPRFRARLPGLEIDGIAYAPPAVSFEAYRQWGVYTCAQ